MAHISLLHGRFLDPERERAFRAAHLEADIRHVRLILGMGVVAVALYFLSDLYWFGVSSDVWERFAMRSAIIAAGLSTIALAGRAKTPARLDALLFALGLVTVLGLLGIAGTSARPGPVPLAGHMVVLMLIYVSLPNVRLQKLGLALMLTAGDVWLVAHQAPWFAGAPLIAALLALVLANAAGLLAGVGPEVARREQFMALQAETAARRAMEEANAKVRTLEGLLPICSSCRRIRDGEGDWQRLERFIEDRSAAQFSHGLCPDCSEQLYPEIHAPEAVP